MDEGNKSEVIIGRFKNELRIVVSDPKINDILQNLNFLIFNEKRGDFRCYPYYYWHLIQNFNQNNVRYLSLINENYKSKKDLKASIKLRDYQKKIIRKLKENEYKGVVILPTGAGKTIIALKLIEELKIRTLIIVPTLDLVDQWKKKVATIFKLNEDEIGLFASGAFNIGDISIATYASASKSNFLRQFMDFFGLLVFDEVHHLPSKTYREIALRLIAPYRIGLTATMVDDEEKELFLKTYIGPVFHGETLEVLTFKGYLADFDYKKIYVSLEEEERHRYLKLVSDYNEYVKTNFPNLKGIDAFKAVLMRSKSDKQAREALAARIEAKKIAFLPYQKMFKLDEILKFHRKDKVIIFTAFKNSAEKISYMFGIPCITSDVKKEIREEILELFRRGILSKIVTAEVLDEGIDVPDANVAVIISGRSSQRQLIQRIGRILRPREGKKAVVYEIVTRGTIEEKMSKKRSI